MTSNDLPPLMILICACLFLAIAIFYPWLSNRFGFARPGPGQRALAAVLGCTLLTLWGIWYSNSGL